MKNTKNKKSRKARRQYDEAFKQNALQLIESGRSVHSVSQSLGVSEGLLYNWKSKAKQKTLAQAEPVNEELAALKKELPCWRNSYKTKRLLVRTCSPTPIYYSLPASVNKNNKSSFKKNEMKL